MYGLYRDCISLFPTKNQQDRDCLITCLIFRFCDLAAAVMLGVRMNQETTAWLLKKNWIVQGCRITNLGQAEDQTA